MHVNGVLRQKQGNSRLMNWGATSVVFDISWRQLTFRNAHSQSN